MTTELSLREPPKVREAESWIESRSSNHMSIYLDRRDGNDHRFGGTVGEEKVYRREGKE